MKLHCAHCNAALGVGAGMPEGSLAFCKPDCCLEWGKAEMERRYPAVVIVPPEERGLTAAEQEQVRKIIEEMKALPPARLIPEPQGVQYWAGDGWADKPLLCQALDCRTPAAYAHQEEAGELYRCYCQQHAPRRSLAIVPPR